MKINSQDYDRFEPKEEEPQIEKDEKTLGRITVTSLYYKIWLD